MIYEILKFLFVVVALVLAWRLTKWSERERLYMRKQKEEQDWDKMRNNLVDKDPKDLAYYKANAEEDYLAVPISVLRYISKLEKTNKRNGKDN